MSIGPNHYWQSVEMRTANWPLYELPSTQASAKTSNTKEAQTFDDFIDIDAPLDGFESDNIQSFMPQSTPVSSNEAEIEPENESFGFFDALDVINPLQHIPFVSHAYRSLTGDEIRASAQIIGGGVYGGAIGALFGVVKAVAGTVSGGTGSNETSKAYTEIYTKDKAPLPVEDSHILAQLSAYETVSFHEHSDIKDTAQSSTLDSSRSYALNVNDDHAAIQQKMLDAYTQY